MKGVSGALVRVFHFTAIVATIYAAGFVVFLVVLPSPFSMPPSGLDGIAVFTGGSGRVDAAMEVVRLGFDGPVLVSGVHPDVGVSTLSRKHELSGDERSRIALDYDAHTTRENVLRTVEWAKARHLQRLGIVTSTYHALRCRLLLLLLAPGLNVVVLPVQPADTGLQPLVREYTKLLLAPFWG